MQTTFLSLSHSSSIRQFFLWMSSSEDKSNYTEEELLILKAQENGNHYGKLYEKYYNQIFIFVNRRVDDLDLTADLCSNIFLSAYKNLPKYELKGYPFSSWLYRIALNEVNGYFRKQKNAWRHVNLQDEGMDVFFEEISIEHDAIDKNKLVVHLLELLDEKDVTFLELRFFEKRSFEEIGYLLDMKANNAKVKTYRILGKLKKKVDQLNWEDFKWQK